MKYRFDKYFREIEEKTMIAYSIAEEARRKGLDPVSKVEIPPTKNLAERVVGMVSVLHPQVKDNAIISSIRQLEKQYGFLELAVALKIAEEVAKQKYCKFSTQLEAIEAGARLAIAYLTLGIVSSPIEGFIRLEERKRKNGKTYLAAFYSGPIRSAGGTAAALSVVVVDYLREIFGYEKYDPTHEEVERAVTEIYDYHERVTNLQYLPTEQEIRVIAKNIPVQIEGEASEDKEVSNYKDLDRVNTNKIRSGFCLVIAEGLALKSAKILKRLKKLKKQGIDLYDNWKFLEKLKKDIEQKEQKKIVNPNPTYIRDIVAGRPIFSHPLRSGGFRLRYGRTRTSGYSAMAINPALTYVIDDFIAIGTQLRTERPGKSSSLSVSDYIGGPIIKIDDGSVFKINTIEDAFKYKERVKEILYLGDILVSYGDFFNRNHSLVPAGYVEEWWFSELKDKLMQIINESTKIEEVSKARHLLNFLMDKYNYFKLSLKQAIDISLNYSMPLYPKFIFYWKEISKEHLLGIYEMIKHSFFNENFSLLIPYPRLKQEQFAKGKRGLELLGVQHRVFADYIIVEKDEALALLLNLGIINSNDILNNDRGVINKKIKNKRIVVDKDDVLSFINSVCEFEIKDKSGTFIGARMGRPEKAKPRVMTGQPNCLFPVGEEGGRLRSFNDALEKGYVKAEFPIYYCAKCDRETIYPLCEICNCPTDLRYFCQGCGTIYKSDFCKVHGKLSSFRRKKIDINFYFKDALKRLGLNNEEIPALVKGVKGTNSKDHIPEHLAKGILRAVFGLPVNKDGTIRYDSTELPITHFKPKEINTPIEKLKELGYTRDIYGNPLENEDQLLALMPQDIILPASRESLDERADKYFVKVAKFIDELLVRFYGMKPFYSVKTREDLVGHLMLCIAPHNAAGTVARIIGFSETQTFLASPFLHAALRRDCDGDEAGFMLLLDALINFSLKYIPSHRGGTQDCPVIINTIIRQNEVDDMVFDMENVSLFPKEFYQAALKLKEPQEIKIEQVVDNLSSNNAFIINFTHPVTNINLGNKCSAYKKLATMQEKVEKQMELGEKIRAVDENHLATLIITRHFIRDIRGNLRKFSMQQFRCVQCNTKYRRPPLIGKCLKCGGRIIFTIAEGTIKKYLEPALSLANKYNVPDYIKQSLELTKASIDAIFGKEESKQVSLKQWFH